MTQPASSAVEVGRPGNRVSCIARAALTCGLTIALAAPAVALAQGTRDE